MHIDQWEVGSHYPAGHCTEILGPVADLETEIQCLLHESSLKLEPFSAAARAILPPEGSSWIVPQKEVERRLDLRTSRQIFSVDPPGCQDIDDTMHARGTYRQLVGLRSELRNVSLMSLCTSELPNGDIEIGVHIADVTYFVPHNCQLDKEAQIRGTTFYLVDRRFDMLPSLLSSGR